MRRKVCSMFLVMTIMLTGCSSNGNVSSESETDIKLDKVESTTQDTVNDATTRDYGDKQVVNGFWVQKNSTSKEEYYRYIPMMSSKIAGIYDLEDDELNKSMDTYSAYNCPDGTITAQLNGKVTTLGYYSNPQLGYNSNYNDEMLEENSLVNYKETFALITDNNNKNVLQSYDVGCITFALYKDLYDTFPQINMKLYGLKESSIESAVGDISTCDLAVYSNYLKSCANQDFSNCDLLAQKEITDSSIYYVDYKHLSEIGDYGQYFIVLEFSQKSGYAYYMNGQLNYNIKNESEYNNWKQQHINQFIAE